jgi:hypothetical protein
MFGERSEWLTAIGGRREGAGRPQGASSHRNLPFGTLTEHNEGQARLVHSPGQRREEASLLGARPPAELLHRAPVAALGDTRIPTNEEIAAEMNRRAMLPVLDLIDEELKRESSAKARPMSEQEA